MRGVALIITSNNHTLPIFLHQRILQSIKVIIKVATVWEKYLENDFFSRSEKSQGILWMAREI